MARPFSGTPVSSHPDPRTRDILMDFEDALREFDSALSKIRRGLLPVSQEQPLGGTSSHHALTDLTNFDDHPQYLYLVGRSGGQTAYGGTGISDDLTLRGSTLAGGGHVVIGPVATGLVWNEASNRLSLGAGNNPAFPFQIKPPASHSNYLLALSTNTGFTGGFLGAIVGGGQETAIDSQCRLIVGTGIGYANPTNAWIHVQGTLDQPHIVRRSATTPALTNNFDEWRGPSNTLYLSIAKGGQLVAGPAAANILQIIADDFDIATSIGGTNIYQFGVGSASGTLTTRAVDLHMLGLAGSSSKITISNTSGSQAVVPIQVTAHATQTAHLTDWKDSGAAVLGFIDAAGAYGLVAGASAGKVYTCVDGSGVGSWQTVTGLFTPDFADNVFRVSDNVDSTKKLAFEVSGVSAGTVRTLTVPDRSSTIMTLGGTQVMDVAGDLTLPSANVTFQCDDALTGSGNGGVFAQIVDIASSNSLILELTGLAFGTNLTIPTAGGEVVTTTAQQTLQSKTLAATGGTGNLIKTVSASSGVAFSDNTTSSKRLRMVLSGAVGNNSFTLNNTAARDYAFTNASGNVLTDGNVAVDANGNVLTYNGSVVITA